jgi:hypothetical protein
MIYFDEEINKYLIKNIFASKNSIAGMSGGVVDWNGEYLFLGSFVDNYVSVCKN